MFADNEVISSRQLRCQLTLGMLGVFLLVLPGFGEIEGIKGVICGIIGGILVAVYCFFLVRIAPAYRNPEKMLGKWGKRIVGGWFLSFFVITGAFFVNVIADVIGVYLVTGSFPYLSHGMILLACAMAGIPQIQRRGRMAETCFGVLVGILVALLFLCMLQQDWKYLGQELMQENSARYSSADTQNLAVGNVLSKAELRTGIGNILHPKKLTVGTYQIFAAFTGIGALPFLLNNVKDHKCKNMIGAVAILIGFLGAVLLLLQGAYGTAQVEARPWPLISLIAGIRIPGTFLARFDPLWIALFLILMLFSVGSTLFYSNYIAKRTEIPIKWYWILLAVYLVSLADFGGYSVKRNYKEILLYLYAPTILFINLFIGWRSRRSVS